MSHIGAKFDDYLDSSCPHCMYVNPTCVLEIKNILSGMQSKNSCNLDEIPMSILKLSPDNILLKLCVAASIAFSIRHKFEPGFPCLSHSLCLLCFDVPLFSVVSRAPRPLLIDFR